MLNATGISKTFGSVRVLEAVAMSVASGEIHAIVGANGAGKSVFVRCITGVYQPDAGGAIVVDGVPAHVNSYEPKAAKELGIRVVHQEAPVIDLLTVAETYGLQRGFPRVAKVGINWRKLRNETSEVLERLSIDISPRTYAGDLHAGDRAMLMLAFALADIDVGAKLLVLDEPTASLPARDAEKFLSAVQVAASHGVGTLFVTHRLGEVFSICHNVTVLRDGKLVRHSAVKDVTQEELIREIVGVREGDDGRPRVADSAANVRHSARFTSQSPAALAKAAGAPAPSPMLELRELGGTTVRNVSFAVQPGEILGVTGIGGSGAEEVGRLIAGIAGPRTGRVIVEGRELPRNAGPRESIAAGIAYVPADRLREGGIRTLSAKDNVSLPRYDAYWRRRAEENDDIAEVIEAFNVRPPEPDRPFHTFSGGNQQKLIVGKWALTRPSVFVLDDPTSGVDPGAREDLYAVMRGLAGAGTAILFISTEPEQLAHVAPRVIIFRDGEIAAELSGQSVTEEAISAASIV